MAFIHGSSYVNFHELNLDLWLSKLKELEEKQDHIDQNIANIIMQLINNGDITIDLVYDAGTEALTLSVTP